METTIKQLMLAKFLFLSGQGYLRKENPMSCGLAVSLFQDSVEMLLRTIANECEANVKDKEPFDALWEIIESAKGNSGKKKPPLKRKMFELNKARVGFKHHGNLPAYEDAVRHANNTEQFLRESINAFFRQDLDSVSLADLIENIDIREYIKKAEKFFSERNFMDSIVECAKGFEIVTYAMTSAIPDVDENRMDISLFSGDDDLADDVKEAMSYIYGYLKIVKDLLTISILNLRVDDYVKFKDIIPRVSMGTKGSFRIRHIKVPYSEQDAQFCLQYVTAYVLSAQQQIGSLK